VWRKHVPLLHGSREEGLLSVAGGAVWYLEAVAAGHYIGAAWLLLVARYNFSLLHCMGH